MEHYCQEHQCKFYRNEKNGKVWYSHKIKDGGYCNEPQINEEVAKAYKEAIHPQEAPQSKSEPVKQESDTRLRSMAISYAKDLVVAGKISLTQMNATADMFLEYINKS